MIKDRVLISGRAIDTNVPATPISYMLCKTYPKVTLLCRLRHVRSHDYFGVSELVLVFLHLLSNLWVTSPFPAIRGTIRDITSYNDQ